MAVKMYLVGGYVRDKILCVKSKDLDYSVEAPSYEAMKKEILRRGGDIFVETPKYLTIRARVPGLGASDFVLCRKDGAYSDGRRPEDVEPGTLYDDLGRRDFTMNAIAMDEKGGYIDPFGGLKDIEAGLIRCVWSAEQRFSEDYLRMLRAIRFSITKNMRMHDSIDVCLNSPVFVNCLCDVSVERIREEMFKAFHHDTLKTLQTLESLPLVRDAIFGNDFKLWLKPSLEK